jgi:hypothetical protein
VRPRIVVFALALAAAGCHRTSPLAGGDLAVADAPDFASGEPTDLGGSDGADMSGDAPDLAVAPGPDMATPVLGKLRIYGGTTSDGWSIVADDANSAWAIKLSDGTQRFIADHQQAMLVANDVAFVIHGGTNWVGQLELWHGDGPPVHLAEMGLDTSPVVPPISDGAGHIAYVTGPGGGPGALWIDTVDHSAPRYVAAVQDWDFPIGCNPTLRFFAGRLLMLHCPSLSSTTKNLLTSFDVTGTGATDVTLATDARSYDVADGVGVLVTSTSGALNIVAADGSGTITQTPLATNAWRGRFTPDGSAVIVVTLTAGGMERIDLTSHAVTQLQASGVRNLYHLSDDGQRATYYQTLDGDAGTEDIWMTDTLHAGTTAVQLSGLTTYMFSAFTSDSAFVFYASDDTGNWIGALRARPVAGGAERVLTTSCYDAIWAGGSRLVYTDNVTGKSPDVRADLWVVDLAGGGAPTKLATQVYNNFDVLSNNTKVIYLEPDVGLHTVALP